MKKTSSLELEGLKNFVEQALKDLERLIEARREAQEDRAASRKGKG